MDKFYYGYEGEKAIKFSTEEKLAVLLSFSHWLA